MKGSSTNTHTIWFALSNDKTYTIDRVKVKHWKEIKNLLGNDDLESCVKIVSVLAECPQEELLDNMNFAAFKKLYQDIVEKVFNNTDAPFVNSLHLEGQDYAFFDFAKMTLGEMSNLDIFFKDESDNSINEVLSVMYRPVIDNTLRGFKVEEYDSDKCAARQHLFDEVDVRVYKGASSFFLATAESCNLITLRYLAKKEKNWKTRKKLLSLHKTLSRAGTKSSYNLPEETFSRLKQSRDLITRLLSTT
jgi:hypothetical protein